MLKKMEREDDDDYQTLRYLFSFSCYKPIYNDVTFFLNLCV